MVDTEGHWSEALTSNNIRAIIRWLRKLPADGDTDVEEILLTFSCWVQRASEFAKKELLTLCFSRCRGLWMFLDRSSFTRVHMLLQRLKNLLSLAQWARRQLTSPHLWHGTGVPCVVCRDTFGSSDVRRGCWDREHRALKQHIWLGRLVQWWGIMGLLPKYPEAHEVKRIAQMWREMGHSHQKAHRCEEGKRGTLSSLIEGIVTQLDRQHGCIWASENFTDRRYPPPNLQALLKLVLVPHMDNMAVQALLMYFVLDMGNFLQCKDDLLQSFCHAFTISPSISQQIRAFWMLDHGQIKASMGALLSPRAAVPRFSWQHHCIIHCLLTRKQPQLALRYLKWTRPAIASIEDAKLCADVLLHNRCVSEAWDLLKKSHTESIDMVMYFLEACRGVGLCAEALKYIPAGCNVEGNIVNVIETKGSQLPQVKEGNSPCPLSAKLYQAQKMSTVSSEELVQLIRKAVMEVRKPHPAISEVVWPEKTERKMSSREMFLSAQPLLHLTASSFTMDMVEKSEQPTDTNEPEEEQSTHNQPDSLSCVDLSSESLSSFTSASSLPLAKQDCPHVYKSTMTLQRISSLLTDGENQSREDSRSLSSTDASPDCPKQTQLLDGATDPIFFRNLSNEALVELVLSAEEGEEDKTNVLLSKDLLSVDTVLGVSMDENLPVNKSTEDGQSVPNLSELKPEPHSFPSPDDEKMACYKGGPEEITPRGSLDGTDWWSSAVNNQEDQSEVFSTSKPGVFDCFFQELHQKTYEHHQKEVTVRCSCAMSETTQDLLTDPHQCLQSEDPIASGSRASTGAGQWDISLLCTMCPAQFQQISGSSRTSSPTCNIRATSVPSDTSTESSPKAKLKADDPSLQSTSAWLDQNKVGSQMKQDGEKYRASSASESRTVITPDNKRPSLVLSQSYSYSLVNFMDFTEKQKGDNKDGIKADKEETAGWNSFGRGSQGAIRNGRSRSWKGKRVKKA